VPSTVRPSLLAGRIPDFFSVLAGACQFGTAWAGLRPIHHHHAAVPRTLHRAPVGQGPSGPGWLATALQRRMQAAVWSWILREDSEDSRKK